VDELDAAVPSAPLKVTGVEVPWREGDLDLRGRVGFAAAGVRVGRLVELEVETADPGDAHAEVERMCRQLLANPLIESYRILLGEPGSSDRRDGSEEMDVAAAERAGGH
jgi:phosphoribosylformylglycinamidine synthase